MTIKNWCWYIMEALDNKLCLFCVLFLGKVCATMHRVVTWTWGHSTLEVMGARTANWNYGSFVERYFSKKGSFSEKTWKRGSNGRIRQVLVNFPGKMQIWTHFGQNFWRKKTRKCWQNVLKRGVIWWEIVKDWSWIIKKGVIRWERVKNGGQWVPESELKKGGQCGQCHASHNQFLVSAPPGSCHFCWEYMGIKTGIMNVIHTCDLRYPYKQNILSQIELLLPKR